MNSSLEIIVGSTQPIEISVIDANDDAEILSSVDKATFTVKADATGVATEFELSITSGNLVVLGGSLIATLTLIESNALTPGFYSGQCFLRFGADTDWRATEIFVVEIKNPVANQV